MNQNNTIFLKHLPITLFIYLSLIVVCYFFFDPSLAWYFHNLGISSSKLLNYASEIMSPECSLVVLPVLYYFFCIVRKNQKLGNKILLLVLAIACSNFVISFAKVLFGRSRPELLFESHLYGFKMFGLSNLWLSFPSGHAVTLGAYAGAISCFLPKYSWPFGILAIILSFIRVIQTQHFLSDILAGVLLGTLVAQFLYQQMNKSHYKL